MRILIVDDSGVMRCILSRAVRALGRCKITEAADGREAWTAFQQENFDLVLTDWHMPCMTGLELTQEIRKVDPDIPIVMVTIVDTKPMILLALEAGVDDYLCKPFDRSLLEAKLDRYLPSALC